RCAPRAQRRDVESEGRRHWTSEPEGRRHWTSEPEGRRHWTSEPEGRRHWTPADLLLGAHRHVYTLAPSPRLTPWVVKGGRAPRTATGPRACDYQRNFEYGPAGIPFRRKAAKRSLPGGGSGRAASPQSGLSRARQATPRRRPLPAPGY